MEFVSKQSNLHLLKIVIATYSEVIIQHSFYDVHQVCAVLLKLDITRWRKQREFHLLKSIYF